MHLNVQSFYKSVFLSYGRNPAPTRILRICQALLNAIEVGKYMLRCFNFTVFQFKTPTFPRKTAVLFIFYNDLMLIGGTIGILSIDLPSSINTAVDTLGSCMSPMAMILTGVKDTSTAAGMILISHTLSCITIPLIFLIFDQLFT